jgi:hypothetical protein
MTLTPRPGGGPSTQPQPHERACMLAFVEFTATAEGRKGGVRERRPGKPPLFFQNRGRRRPGRSGCVRGTVKLEQVTPGQPSCFVLRSVLIPCCSRRQRRGCFNDSARRRGGAGTAGMTSVVAEVAAGSSGRLGPQHGGRWAKPPRHTAAPVRPSQPGRHNSTAPPLEPRCSVAAVACTGGNAVQRRTMQAAAASCNAAIGRPPRRCGPRPSLPPSSALLRDTALQRLQPGF